MDAKVPSSGGNPNAVIAAPEIKKFDIEANHDFIILGCDGIFDKMSNEDCVKSLWTSLQ